MGMGIALNKSPAMYSSKGEYLISDSLTERGPILLDVPNDGTNYIVMTVCHTQIVVSWFSEV